MSVGFLNEVERVMRVWKLALYEGMWLLQLPTHPKPRHCSYYQTMAPIRLHVIVSLAY